MWCCGDALMWCVCRYLHTHQSHFLNIFIQAMTFSIAIALEHIAIRYAKRRNNLIFLFNDKIFSQIDGVGMGNPLGPTFANLFLSHHELNWLQNY